jgi:hypothetical protein
MANDQLCDQCSLYNFKLVYSPWKGGSSWPKDGPREMQRSFNDCASNLNCPFCRLLVRCLSSQTADSRITPCAGLRIAPYTAFRIAESESWQTIYSELTVYNGPRSFSIRLMEPSDSREDKAIFHSRPIGAEVNIELLLRWLRICEEHSPRHSPGRYTSQTSMRLFAIDVARKCITQLPDSPRYAALSYVWGPPDTPQLKWTARTKARLHTPGGLSHQRQDVPTTITDAMTICESLQIQYLWVDALCIPQDDDRLKMQFISEMDSIYSNSFVTIVAVSGKNSWAGLPGSRSNSRQVFQFQEEGKGPHSNKRPP